MSRDLLLVILSLFTWGVGEGMFIYFQPLYLQQWGAAPLAIGAILGASGLAMALAQAPAGYLADRVGRRPMMWASWILGTLAAGVMAAAGNLGVFAFGLVVYGFTGFILAPMNAYISEARGHWSVGRAIAYTNASWQLGSVIGPFIGGYLGLHSGLRPVYFAGTALLGLSTAIVLFIHPQPVHPETIEIRRSQILRDRRFLTFAAVMFFSVLALYLPQPLTANFLQDQRGLSLAAIGQLGSLTSLGNVVLGFALGHLNPGWVLLLCQGFVAAFALLIWNGTGMAWYGLGSFMFGAYRLARSMTIGLARPLVPHNEIGLAYGVVETANSSATMLAPVLAGWIYQQQPARVYPVSIALLGITFLASAWYLFASPHAPARAAQPADVEVFEIR